MATTLQFQPPLVLGEEPMKPTKDAPEQATEVDMVVPTTMDVDTIRKPNIAWDRSIFDFILAPSDFNEPSVSSSASGSNPKSILSVNSLAPTFNQIVGLGSKLPSIAKAFTKVWERAYDLDASPDLVVRTLQDAIDKMYTEPDDLTEGSVDSDYGHIHQETLKCLPEKITTTSHYRYVLAMLRRDKERLHEQIETDRDMIAAMDTTLEALRSFVVDKGKGTDQG
ncbi:hypothetical protein K443DRAFT_13659 [Laccaria amethystina LaAM-08-1]|uniref:Uncharacterized protein n=1 Tax=Laccaria amethystina LaAM-08-1 TaxID=1095629 RepID=A0A0C9WUX2_9AGAR|nr:hypothetical protein K443DRAFT_13659 [Laccaria amethystina LaAM-08-1]